MLKLIVPVLVLGSWVAFAGQGLDLVPTPKQVKDYQRTMVISRPEELTIVLGDKATETEEYAAHRLQELVESRFGVNLPLQHEGDSPPGARQTILLGQMATNSRLNQLCQSRKIEIAEDSPGPDGYVIEVLDEDSTVLVCGSNNRGVVYGAQTLFKLLHREGDGLALPVVAIRDWPSIPWRGRPYTSVSAHLEPGVMDAYMWAGLNFIDVRAGAFGYGPDAELDQEQIKLCIGEAHRRGLFVYGTVSCGIKPEKFDGAIRTFRKLIELGVDGLWISFDDPGGGVGTTELVERVIELGQQEGFTGREIATTPPSGSYQYIETDFNRELAQVAGMADATWFFTRPPCREDMAAARQVGLNTLPAWWHNWPRTDAGFTHGSYGGRSFRPDGGLSYMEVPPLTWGWHRPDYEALRDAPDNTDTVMMWGGWQPEYTCAVLGIWAWSPAEHDFEKTRRAIYETVYGPSNIEAMVRFDDALHELKGMFALPQRSPDPTDNFPPRLKATSDPDQAENLVEEMEKLRESVAASAPQESLLAPARLEKYFLEPMAAELETARVLISLPRPEDWWPAHEAEVLARLRAGDAKAVVRPKLKEQLATITEALSGLLVMDTYEQLWTERAEGGLAYWQKELERRVQALQKRIADNEKAGLDVKGMIASIDQPPDEGRLLTTVTPQQLAASPISFQGKWLTGLYPSEEPRAFVMSFPGHTPSVPGDFCQVTFRLPRPDFQGKLKLQVHLTDEYDSDRWTGYRFYQLLHDGEVIWEEDIALTRRGGREWSSIDVSDLAAEADELRFTLRLLDKRPVGNYTTTIFIGPVRLVGLP